MPTKYDLLDELTKEELLEVAEYYDIEVPRSWRKYEVIDVISSTFYKDQIVDIVKYWTDEEFSEIEESAHNKYVTHKEINSIRDNRNDALNPNNDKIGLIISPKREVNGNRNAKLPRLSRDLFTRIILFLNLDNPLMIIAYALVMIWWAFFILYRPYFISAYKTIEPSNGLLILYIALITISLAIRPMLKASESRSMKYSATKLFLTFLGALFLAILFIFSSFAGLTQSIFIYGQFFLFPVTINLIIVPAYEVFKVSETEKKA